jgi:uncharacterized protein (TIGR00730 family)
MRRLCVFCGSSSGARPSYADGARALAAELCRRGVGLVYGGAAIGLMGVVADAVLAGGGEVIGVIPRGLATREIAHAGCTELRVVDTMHERKATMASLADGFVGLPGGLGTLEELCEMLTWTQLGVHAKPVGVLDVAGYWDGLRRQLADAAAAGFVHAENVGMLRVHDDPSRLLDDLAAWRPPRAPRVWLGPGET